MNIFYILAIFKMSVLYVGINCVKNLDTDTVKPSGRLLQKLLCELEQFE